MSDKGDLVWSENGVTVALKGSTGASSLDAFTVSVYPITRARCASCHATSQQPLHASANTTTAHNAVLNSYKVDFANIPNSRLVKKLQEGHNCWGSCTANATEMQLAIQDWKDLIESTSGGGGNVPTSGVPSSITAQTVVSQAISAERAQAYATAAPLRVAAANATLTAGGGTIARVTNNTPPYIHIPNTANNNVVGGSDTVNVATFSGTTPVAANNAAIWAWVWAKAPNDNAFNVKVNNGNFVTFDLADTNGAFTWQRVPGNFNFPAGASTIRVSNRKDGARIAAMLVTTDQTFTPGADGTTAGAITLRWSINGVGLTGGFVEFRLEDFDSYSYKVSQLKIISPNFDARVKGVYVMMNGVFNPQNANLTQVDQTVPRSAGGTVLTPSAMILLKDKGDTDTFKLGFEILARP